MARPSCGSCTRIWQQIEPICQRHQVRLSWVDVDDAPGDEASEYGDRVPVVVINGEEFCCWEVDDAELAAELVHLMNES